MQVIGRRIWRAASRVKRWVREAPHRALYGSVLATLWIVRPFVTVRIATFNAQRVGEFICRIDMAIALCVSESPEVRGRRVNIFVMPASLANEQLRVMYVRALRDIPAITLLDCRTSWLARALEGPARMLALDVTHRNRRHAFYCGEGTANLDTCGWRPSGRPIIQFTSDELDRGWSLVQGLGILPGTKFVCLHIRDGAYLRESLPDRDWSYHDYRNPQASTFIPMVEHLITRGYVVVRMGKVVEGHLPIIDERFVDYASSSQRSDFLDVFLYAHSVLTVSGGISGIDQLGYAFNVPNVGTNFVPFDDPRWAIDLAVVIPALFREIGTGEVFPLSRMIPARYGNTESFEAAGIEIVPNSAEEVTEVVIEGIERLEGTWQETADDQRRQVEFWRWAESCGIDSGVPSGPWDADHYRALMGRDFLRRHSEALLA